MGSKLLSLSVLSVLFFIAPLSASAAVSFVGGWEGGQLGPGNWKSVQAVSTYRYQLVTDAVRTGTYSARVEVRPNDNPLSCCLGTERAQVSHMLDKEGNTIWENPSSETKYFAFSVRLSADWVSPRSDSVVELHGPAIYEASPALALRTTGTSSTFLLDLYTGDIGDASNKGIQRTLGSLNPGTWVDFIFKITFGERGVVEVWRRDEDQKKFTKILDLPNIPTLQFKKTDKDNIGNHYWKLGYYRSASAHTNIVWNDGGTRADTFDDILVTAFGITEYTEQGATLPSPPTNLNGIAISSTAISLSWGTSTTNSIVTGYYVFRNGAHIGATQVRSYIDSGVSPGGTYKYTVAAYDTLGIVSAQSESISVTTPAPPFGYGARIEVASGVAIYTKAAENSLVRGTQPRGLQGVITRGPKSADGYTWWQVNFDTGSDGWVQEQYLTTMLTTAPSQVSRSNASMVGAVHILFKSMMSSRPELAFVAAVLGSLWGGE